MSRRRLARTGIFALLALAILAGLGRWLLHRWSHVYVDDARIAANVVTVSSEASARVIAIPVIAGDRVSRGDPLVRLDSRQPELALQESDRETARLEAEQSQLRAQQALVRSQTDSRRAAARARLAASEAESRAASAELETARRDDDRLNALRDQGYISPQGFEAARAKFVMAQQQELRRAASVRAAQAELAEVDAQAAEVEVLERRIAVLDVQKKVLAARRAQQLVHLGHHQLRAEFDGVVDAVFVDAGEYVAQGTRLLMYHDPAAVWVDVFVKETDFRRVKTSAAAVVSVDAYPGRTFKGEVARTGHAATSQFALLPTPNPSGNFTKVTQRLPVRIAIEQDAGLLRPGMMVEVEIRVDD